MALIPWWIRYPNVNDEIMNLDWLLRVSNENTEKISNFINLNTIKYADPILWDITSQYEANTIVVDPQTGDAYISTEAVPYGVHLSNTDYWTKIYNYADAINTLEEQIAAANERLSTTASAPRAIGDLVWLNGELYKITAPMIAGDSYVVGSNCDTTTIETELQLEKTARADADTALGERITSEAEAREDADDALDTRIDAEAAARIKADNKFKNIINVLYPPEDEDSPLVADWTSVSNHTDNTELFQTLIDKYGSGYTYYFPGGAYGFDGSISIPFGQIKICGDGFKYTRFRIHDSIGNIFLEIGNTDAMTPLVIIEDIGFIADIFNENTSAIQLKNPRTCKISNILFQDFHHDLDIYAQYASSGQTSIIEWCTHSIVNRNNMNRFIYFRNESSTIFPNGYYIQNNHGSFGGVGEFISGYGCDIWINNNNVAHCSRAITISAANQRVGGDVQILGNTLADCVGTPIYLQYYNRGIIISDNFIEERATNETVFPAIRLKSINGVTISGNSIGTERTAIGLNHNIALLLLEGTVASDIIVTGNVCYLGAYVLSHSGVTSEFVKMINNIFKHVGTNTITANALYIGSCKNSDFSNNVFDYATINSAYSVTGVHGKDNMYSGTLNTPFSTSDNYLIE